MLIVAQAATVIRLQEGATVTEIVILAMIVVQSFIVHFQVQGLAYIK